MACLFARMCGSCAACISESAWRAVAAIGMCFAASPYKLLLRDWASVLQQFMLDGDELTVVECFTHASNYFIDDGSTVSAMSTPIFEAWAACPGVKHLQHRTNISLKVKNRVRCAAVHCILLGVSETWSLRAEDIHRLEAFDHHQCLGYVAWILPRGHMRNAKIRIQVPSAGSWSIVSQRSTLR